MFTVNRIRWPLATAAIALAGLVLWMAFGLDRRAMSTAGLNEELLRFFDTSD